VEDSRRISCPRQGPHREVLDETVLWIADIVTALKTTTIYTHVLQEAGGRAASGAIILILRRLAPGHVRVCLTGFRKESLTLR